MEYVSNCCGAELCGIWLDVEICSNCKEHCAMEEVEEEIEKVQGLKVEKKLVDKYWNQRVNKPLE